MKRTLRRSTVGMVAALLMSAAMAKALAALGDIKIHMLSLSATGINLTILVDEEQVGTAIARLHDAFFREQIT